MATKEMKKMLVELTREPHVGENLVGVVHSDTVAEQLLKATEIVNLEKVFATDVDDIYLVETQNSLYVAHLKQ